LAIINARLREASDTDERALLESHKAATATIREAKDRAGVLQKEY
jgi:hypothetical protein